MIIYRFIVSVQFLTRAVVCLGTYVASSSSATGFVFIWETKDGSLKRKLPGHEAGVYGTAWSKGGNSGQQVATVDRGGTLILWA